MNTHHHQAERWISLTLRIGVIASALLLGAGLLVEFLQPQPAGALVDPLAVVTAALSHEEVPPGVTLLSGGILILMFTPIVRVVAALGTFIQEKDRPFVVVAAVVLTMFVLELLISLA